MLSSILFAVAVQANEAAPEEPRVLFELLGAGPEDGFGCSVAGGGDADHDGVPDVLVGAFDFGQMSPYEELQGEKPSRHGYARLYSGKDGRLLHEFVGTRPDYAFGLSVAFAGDQNGDDHDDVLVGSPSASLLGGALFGGPSGEVLLYSGKDGSLLDTLKAERTGPQFGWRVVGLGDVDADGLDDFAVGDPSIGRPGAVVVFSARTRRLLFRIEGGSKESMFPTCVARAGDLDGDGVQDLAVSTSDADPGGIRDRGTVRVVSGKDGSALFALPGEEIYDYFGSCLAGVGDVDGDDVDDLVIGATGDDGAHDHSGSAVVLSGKTHRILRRVRAPADCSVLGRSAAALGDVDGDDVPDFAVSGWRQPAGWVGVYSGGTGELILEESGQELARAGDLDGDGVDELLVGTWNSLSRDDRKGIVRVVSMRRK